MPTIKNNVGDTLIIAGRSGMKFIDKNMKEYYINSEMVISDEYDFVIFSESIKYYDDYEKEIDTNNIEYYEEYDDKKGYRIGKIKYKNKFDSNISKREKQIILKKIIELSEQEHIKMEIK
jgi:hypothetical protein